MKKILFSILLLSVHFFSFADHPTLPSNFLPLPIIRQAYTYTCGPAALLSALYYWQVYDKGEASLYTPLKTTEEGTQPERIAEVSKDIIDSEISYGEFFNQIYEVKHPEVTVKSYGPVEVVVYTISLRDYDYEFDYEFRFAVRSWV